jgi:hypothetical protein
MYVYSAYNGSEEIAMVVDGSPVGPLGRLFIVPQDEVVEVPDIAGNELIRHKGYLGVVKVTLIKSKTELRFDLEKARQESLAIIEASDRRRFEAYVDGVVTDRTSKGKIPKPTPPALLDVMHRRGYTLEAYGIRTVGSQEQDKDSKISNLQNQLDEMKALLRSAMAGSIRTEPEESEEHKKNRKN